MAYDYRRTEITMEGKRLTPSVSIEGVEDTISGDGFCIPQGKVTVIYLDENGKKQVKLKAEGEKILSLETYKHTAATFEAVIPEGCTSITNLRAGYRYLTKVTLPSTLQRIASGTFAHCYSLEEVTGLEKTGLTSISGVCFCCTNIRTITLPRTVESIGDSAFSGCTKLTEVKGLKETKVRELTEMCFSGCHSLKKLEFPPSLRVIRRYALAETGLETLIVPEGLERLEALHDGKPGNALGIRKVVLPSHNLETSVLAFAWVEEVWCTRKSVRSALHGSQCTVKTQEEGSRPVIYYQKEDGTVLRMPRVYVHKKKASALAEILEGEPGEDFREQAAVLCGGTVDNHCFGILLFLVKHFLTGEAKKTVEEVLDRLAGFAARRAYQERDREEAVQIVSQFVIQPLFLEDMMDRAEGRKDSEFSALLLEAKKRAEEGRPDPNRFSP